MSHQRSSGLRNNSGILRILLAAAVVFSDSFLLGVGVTDADPMKRFNQGQAITGHVAVDLFFTMSGYLVTLSLNARCFRYRVISHIESGRVSGYHFRSDIQLLDRAAATLSVIGYLSWHLVERWFLPRERQE